jgi:hypothetical protein
LDVPLGLYIIHFQEFFSAVDDLLVGLGEGDGLEDCGVEVELVGDDFIGDEFCVIDQFLPFPEEERVHVAVVLHEGVLHLLVEPLLRLELLFVDEVDDVVYRRQDVDQPNAQAQHGGPRDTARPQLHIEENLSGAT